MSARVIPIFPQALDGAEREAALVCLRGEMAAIAGAWVSRAFDTACQAGGSVKLGLDDVVPLFVEAMRRELDTAGV